MEHIEKTIRSELVFSGRIFEARRDVVRLEDGRETSRETVTHRFGGACVLAQTDDGSIWFVRQFRYPYRRSLLELPAGKLDPGETPEQCARRELEEETGLIADRLIDLGLCAPSPGYVCENIYLFAAEHPRPSRQKLDEGEFLSLEAYTLDQAVDMVLRGEILDAKSQIAVLKYAALRGNPPPTKPSV